MFIIAFVLLTYIQTMNVHSNIYYYV